ncbi:MAG: DUF1178 family protein [Hyphomicrobiaceae bacterium]
MIRYQLHCDKDHDFDVWFSNSDAYDKQIKRKLITCPDCGSHEVSKSIMAPNIGVKSNKKTSSSTLAPAEPRPQAADPKAAEAQREVMTAMRQLRKVVEENAEYVGPRFAEEARKIHYKEAEEKGIYGEATQSDVKDLMDEGIEIHPLPILPEDQN